MSKLRDSVVSTCEKKFLLNLLKESKRLDGRAFNEFRDLKIEFGKDWGSCFVSLGETQVLAQVSCEIQLPKSTRPSEGILYINLELNPIAAPQFEAGRQSDLSVQLNRILEKCIKDSRAVDLESLCIKVKEKVWALRVDLNVLNHEGNILDCASVAALAALKHFRRPDVTCDGENIIIHTYAQRDTIPTVIHHYPVCISYAIYSNGEIILADPSLLEENVSEAQLMLGLNAYKELCGFYLGGSASVSADVILKVTNRAAKRALTVIDQLKEAVEQDDLKRQQNEEIGFQHSHSFSKDLSQNGNKLADILNAWRTVPTKKKKTEVKPEIVEQAKVEPIGKGNQSAVLLPPETENSPWNVSSDESEETENSTTNKTTNQNNKQEIMEVSSGSDSEEDQVIVLNAKNKMKKTKTKTKK
ncbi:PREDICTED: exosome complex component rrp45 [Nicrophorus vespilloides]|uniref:Exosome complex component RRP45 n=1 Tax=Nicrophorus vespilloides TaxID=110193 RepID=A0ABM1NH70_NICVS|nr:PREDICTED: exosome complex component rrp45 [Nicrophorus vespilloides]